MADPHFVLIENGELYDPEPRGRQSVLLAGDRVVRVGEVDRRALDRLGAPYEPIDAAGMYVTPGFIDPHQHLLGGSGEGGRRCRRRCSSSRRSRAPGSPRRWACSAWTRR